MQSNQFSVATRIVPSLALLYLVLLSAPVPAQWVADQSHKALPVKLENQVMIFPESVVLEQWPHTPTIANPPQRLQLLNPGECVRIGAIATGDDRDEYLGKSQLSFRVEFAGQTQDHPSQPLAAIKQVKPQGSNFIDAALNYAGVPLPDVSLASLGASAASWCVPDDAQDGTATFEAEAETPDGHKKLQSVTIPVESFETGSKRTFKDGEEFEQFTMQYHYQPNPARLLPALQFFAADEALSGKQESTYNFVFTLAAVLKADPAAAKDFMARVSAQSGRTTALAAVALFQAGYDIGPILKTMSSDEQQALKDPQLPSPYEFNAPQDIPARFDSLWGIFCITGDFAPIQRIAAGLAWRSDWDDLEKAIHSSNKPLAWTPSIGRAGAYSAAGWSMSSFQRTDPLAADYIEFMIASPGTPTEIKAELKGLSTNPAFKQQGDK